MDRVPLVVRVAVAAFASVAVALGAAAAPGYPSPASPAFPDFPDFPDFPAFPAPAPPSPVFRLLAASAITGIPHSPPVPGDVIRPYDPPDKPWLPGHRGVDLAAGPGSVVASSADGVVHFAGSVAGTPTVSVMHADGIRTTYQPVVARVSRGDRVLRGDPLGVLGDPAPDPGLHWGALRGSDYLNPLDLLARRPIVLKPPVPDGG